MTLQSSISRQQNYDDKFTSFKKAGAKTSGIDMKVDVLHQLYLN